MPSGCGVTRKENGQIMNNSGKKRDHSPFLGSRTHELSVIKCARLAFASDGISSSLL